MKHVLPIAVVCLLVLAAVIKTTDVVPDDPEGGHLRRVLIVAETAPSPKYTDAQMSALLRARNGDIRKWLDENCRVDGVRILDPDDPISVLPKFWQDAMARERKELPWVQVHNGTRWTKEQTFKDADDLKRIIGAL